LKILGLADGAAVWQTGLMTKQKGKPKAKRNPSPTKPRQPKEDFNQATYRVMQEIIKRSES